MIESKEKERMRKLQVWSYYSILFYKDFIKRLLSKEIVLLQRLLSKEIVLLHRGQLYNPESAIRTWNKQHVEPRNKYSWTYI